MLLLLIRRHDRMITYRQILSYYKTRYKVTELINIGTRDYKSNVNGKTS